eukprot:TRINITY_DN22753_c0_g1_i1.p3 TRINITY_DN22753_c0_g1~~TRINITY_DN22753_c0_g1_i1.p3  ORF type:complete len:112 (+),score=4.23 TRINITY_DN22753_c0_g1_i1:49-336(+)
MCIRDRYQRRVHGATKGINPALKVAFSGGSVMGMSVVGLALLGITIVFYFCITYIGSSVKLLSGQVLPIISGFSLGASSIALFFKSRWWYFYKSR